MAYTINRYNGAQITVVADGTIDTTLDVKLIGKNYAGYGEIQNENLVFLLEKLDNIKALRRLHTHTRTTYLNKGANERNFKSFDIYFIRVFLAIFNWHLIVR